MSEAQLRKELEEANAAFDEFMASSKEIEQELTRDLDEAAEREKQLKKEMMALKDAVVEKSNREAALQGELAKSEDAVRERDAELAKKKEEIVGLETQVTQLSQALRVAEANAAKAAQKYEELLETSAMEKAELEDLRKEVSEAKHREKVKAVEGEDSPTPSAPPLAADSAPTAEALAQAKREAALVTQMLKEVVSAISKGEVTLPSTTEVLNMVKTSGL